MVYICGRYIFNSYLFIEMSKDKQKATEEHLYVEPGTNKFKKGNPGGGRPKGALSGTSIKMKIQEYLAKHPEDLDAIVLDYVKNPRHRDLLWKMLDGMPSQNKEVTHTIPQNIIDLIKQAHDSPEELPGEIVAEQDS